MRSVDGEFEELASYHAPAPDAIDSTRLMRQARAAQLDDIHATVATNRFYTQGFRSPTDWLATTTHDSVGHARSTLHLADRIQRMPVTKATFATGSLAESALRLLAEAWHADIADTFERDEEMLCGWATRLSFSDFRIALAVWRQHADPDRAERTAEERYDQRALHMSTLLDDMGRLDATLDPEGYAIVAEAVRAHSQRFDGDERSAAQRRADGLVSLAESALAHVENVPGKRRRKPKVVATIAYDDLIAQSGGGLHETDTTRHVATPEAIRRLACDCGLHRLVTGPGSTILDHGRRQRVVSDSLFDVLALRDHGCRFDGCTTPASACDAHHAIHWADDGETEPDNLALLCWHHHHFLHEQHWSMSPLGGGHFTLIDDTGARHQMRPPTIGLARHD